MIVEVVDSEEALEAALEVEGDMMITEEEVEAEAVTVEEKL